MNEDLGSRPSMRRHEYWLYAAGGLLWASGLGWVVSHYVLAGHGEFGDAPRLSELWWLRVHGAAMLAFLIALGVMVPLHMAPNWRRRANRRSGVLMLLVVGILVLTGYALYYVGDESSRPWISAVHWIVGLGAAGVLAAHWSLGTRRRRASASASRISAASTGR